MPRVTLSRGFKVVQIDFPEITVEHPDGTSNIDAKPEGRKLGSVHFGRNRVVTLTDAELGYLKANRPEVHASLDILPEPKLPGRAARRLAQAQEESAKRKLKPKAEPKAEPKVEPKTRSTKKKKSEPKAD